MKAETIQKIFLYIVFAIFFIILKEEMLSIVANSLDTSISYATVGRIYYVLLAFFVLVYILFYYKKLKGRITDSILGLFVCIYALTFLHSVSFPLQSIAYYIIIPMPVLLFVFMANVSSYIRGEKVFDQVFVVVFSLLAFYYFQSYDIRSQALYALTSSSAYVVLYFLPFLLCGNNKAIKYLAIIVTVVVILLSYKRAGIIALAVALVAYWLVDTYIVSNGDKKKPRIVGLVMFLLLVVVCYMVFMGIESETDNHLVNRFQSISEDKGSGRIDVYRTTWNMIMESDMTGLLFGHGWNSVLRDSPLKLSAHNDLLEVIYEFGFIVAGIYIYMLYQLLSFAKKLIKEHSRFAPAFIASLVIFFVNSMVSHILIYSNYMSVFTAFWAYVYIKARQDKTISYEKSNARLRYSSRSH